MIIISAYIPLFTLERVERRLFTPMAFTVCYALLGSMLLALTLIPVLATYLFRKGAKSWDNPVLRWLHRAIRADPRRCRMRRPWSRSRRRPRSWSGRVRARRASRARNSCRSWTRASSGSAPISRPAYRWTSPPQVAAQIRPCFAK